MTKTKHTSFRLSDSTRTSIRQALLAKVPVAQQPAAHRAARDARVNEAVSNYSKGVLPLDLWKYWFEQPGAFNLDRIGCDTVQGWINITVAPEVNLLPTGRLEHLQSELRTEVRAAYADCFTACKPYEELSSSLKVLLRTCQTSAKLLEQMPEAAEVVAKYSQGGATSYPVATDIGRQALARLTALGATLP